MKRVAHWLPIAILTAAVVGGGVTPWAVAIGQTASADRLLQQGEQQAQTGQLAAAVQTWQQALKGYQHSQNQSGMANVLEKLGAAALAQERYQDAIGHFTALRPLLEAPPMATRRAFALSNLGIAQKNLGHYGQAAKLQRQAGNLLWQLSQAAQDSDRIPLRQALGQVLLNLGNAEEAQGSYEKAQQAYEQSLKLAIAVADRPGESIALHNLGGIASKLGKDDVAIARLEESLQLAPNDPNSRASTWLNLGAIYHFRSQAGKTGDLQTAIRYYQDSLALAEKTQNRALAAAALSSLGAAYEDRQDYRQAIAFHQKSVALATAIGDLEIQAKSLNNLGHTFFAAQRLPEAIASLRQAIARLDRLRLGLTDNYKVAIFDTQLNSYNLLQQILIADRQPEAALEASEQGRARAFAELLVQRQSQSAAVPPITLAQIRHIAQTHQATLVEYAIVPDDDFKFRGKQRGREAELFIWVVQPTGKIDFRRVDLKSLWQKQGPLRQMVSVARCLNPDCPTVAEVAAETRGARLPGASRVRSAPPPLPDSIAKAALTYPGLPELYQVLIQPIADLLPADPDQPVVFIPQESLFLVPFAALPDAQGHYLIERHTLRSAPSIQVLGLTQQQAQRVQGQAQNMLVVGNPDPMPDNLERLPGAEKEAIAVAQILNTAAIIGKQATKNRVVAQFRTARVIHLATHGLLERGQSSSLEAPGAIALAPTRPNENGLLTAEEIIRLPRLSTELVVLSACDTGRGTITGDGVVGLSRSWIAAGVPSVVVSLWAVNDESTAVLMVDFYRSLQQQPHHPRNPAVALRHAMLTTMQKYPDPKKWAAFTLVGE